MHAVRSARHAALTVSRRHSIQLYRPVTLHATIHPPSTNDVNPQQPVIAGLACMVGLYKSIDGTFVDLWNGVQRHADPSWLYRMQADLLQAVPGCVLYTEGQAIEILVTQHWLRNLPTLLATRKLVRPTETRPLPAGIYSKAL